MVMTVRVLLFASYADAVGRSEVNLALPPDASAGDVLARIKAMTRGARVPDSPMLAVNQKYARPEQRLAPNDEIAIIPPVAGG